MLLYLWVCIQIILESLPISSSGHVKLLQTLLYKFGYNFDVSSSWAVDFVLHGATFIILLIFFFTTWWQMIVRQPISFESLCTKLAWRSIGKALLFVAIADLVTILFWVTDVLPPLVLPVGFMITAFCLHKLKYAPEGRQFSWDLRNGFYLGVVQGYSLLPGVSRFGMTFVTCRYLEYDRESSLALSFLIEMPLVLAGCVKGLLALRYHQDLYAQFFHIKMLLVIVGASCLSYGVLYWVHGVIKRGNMWRFSWYMLFPICLSLIV